MKILCSVFSYNRYAYLKNFIDSWEEFFGHGDLLVVDDGSDEPELVEYLEQLSSKERVTVINVPKKKIDGYIHGGLYHNMDIACEYAFDNNYTYLYFTQDDTQFLWHDESFVKKIDKYFSEIPKLCMVRNRFFPMLINEKKEQRVEGNGDHYVLKNTSMLDVGVTRPSLIKEYNFKFALGCEPSNSAWWKASGYKAIYLKSPSCCFVPQPVVYRNKKREGVIADKPNKYYVQPFSSNKIEKLKSLPINEVPIMEEWYKPWGWGCVKPYFERSEEEYYEQIFKKKYKTQLAKHVVIFKKIVPISIRSKLRLLLKDR